MSDFLVYIGTYTKNNESEGIYSFKVKDKQITSTPLLSAKIANPTFIEILNEKKVLYAISETTEGSISVFSIQDNAKLKHQQTLPSFGAHPCHIAISPSKDFLVATNYSGGNFIVRQITKNGKLSDGFTLFEHQGSSINPKRQEKPHPHGATFSLDGNFLYISDLGIDKIVTYRYIPTKNAFERFEIADFKTRPGAGPRHLTFSADGNFAYLINELDNTISSLKWKKNGIFKEIQTVSTLPANFAKDNTAAEIQIHQNGKFLYASNRGHDSIVVFSISPEGYLNLVGHKTENVKTPRHFEFSPDGLSCLVSNQDSDTVALFEISDNDGMPQKELFSTKISKPVCAKFAKVKP